jgi:protein subunit release factor B
MAKQLLFSVTKNDLKIDTFRAGGPGGQNQNKRETGVRITHPASGAVGIARENRTQEANKKAAFHRLVESHKFKAWHKREVASRSWHRDLIESEVKATMKPENIRVEVREDGKWVQATGDLTSPTPA